MILQGRCLQIHCLGPEKIQLMIQNQRGVFSVCYLAPIPSCKRGDILRCEPQGIQVLTISQTNGDFKLFSNSEISRLKLRNQLEQRIRSFFFEQGFLETRTPLLASSPGAEPYLHPFSVFDSDSKFHAYLPTSPEFAMKKLLSKGLEKIFQICPAFRDEPSSSTHLCEFTILEWYRAFENEWAILKDLETLCFTLSKHFLKCTAPSHTSIFWDPPWPRKSVSELFKTYLNFSLTPECPYQTLFQLCQTHKLDPSKNMTWDDLFYLLWLNKIEPFFQKTRPLVVTHYPRSQAALAQIDPHTHWARRFEVYIGGLEIANAFYELTCSKTQRKRFQKDHVLRKQLFPHKVTPPLAKDFLKTLEHGLPPCAGIAVGIDRLAMLFSQVNSIDQVVFLSPLVHQRK